FTGTGNLTGSADRVRAFTAATGGTELPLTGAGAAFDGAALRAGVTVFLSAVTPSAAVDDTTLTMQLTVAGSAGLSATHKLTAVELNLGIAGTPPTPGTAPPALEPRPALAPSVRLAPGRYIQVATPAGLLTQYQGAPLANERAWLTILPPRPAGLPHAVELELTALSGRTNLWATE